MRVAIDTAALRRPHAGTARWIRGLIGALQAEPDVTVAQLSGPPRMGNGALYRPLNMLAQRWWYDYGMRHAARHLHADVLFMPALYAAPRGRPPQLAAILDVNFLSEPGTYESLFARYASWVARRTVTNADRIVTISEFSRREIVHHLGANSESISVVYPGLSDVNTTPQPRPLAQPYALYVGATERHKNIGLLLDAWDQLGEELTLAIVGRPGRDHASIVERAASMNGSVVVVGGVSDDELEGWYQHAELFVFPSLTEGFGYPPLEAQQRGLPVVAARAGALPEVLGDAAIYHDPRDADDLATHIRAVLGDSLLRSKLSAAGRGRAARYSWQTAGAQTRRLLNELVDLQD